MCAVVPPAAPAMAGCMPIGKPTSRRRCGGFTYVWLLFGVALSGAALAGISTAWSTASQREKERESMFRGQQMADAVAAWRAAAQADGLAPEPGPYQPADLLEDLRGPQLRRHLRRIYDDPLTGRPDWVWLRDERGVIEGLRSRSTQAALITRGLQVVEAGRLPCVCDRIFKPRPAPVAPASQAASAASG